MTEKTKIDFTIKVFIFAIVDYDNKKDFKNHPFVYRCACVVCGVCVRVCSRVCFVCITYVLITRRHARESIEFQYRKGASIFIRHRPYLGGFKEGNGILL